MNCQYEIELFRVRKSWDDFASQKGVFLIFENAKRVAKKYRCNIYNSKKECVWNFKEENLCLN